jgi:hypothetical protein
LIQVSLPPDYEMVEGMYRVVVVVVGVDQVLVDGDSVLAVENDVL